MYRGIWACICEKQVVLFLLSQLLSVFSRREWRSSLGLQWMHEQLCTLEVAVHNWMVSHLELIEICVYHLEAGTVVSFDGGSRNDIPPAKCSGVPMSGHCILLKVSNAGLSFLGAKVLMIKRELILVTRNGKTSVSLISQKSSSVQAHNCMSVWPVTIFFTITLPTGRRWLPTGLHPNCLSIMNIAGKARL